MRIARQASTLLRPRLLLVMGMLISTQVLALPPDFTDCGGLSGPGAGLCKAAMALQCGALNSEGACSTISERYEKLTGAPAFWLDRQGPEIACSDPADGAILDQTPGSQINLQGTVSDTNGVSELLVNGSPVAVDPSGAFTADLSTGWGMNFVELSATDGVGNQSKRTCTFLLSDTWVPNGGTLSSSISLKARQAVIDDNNRSDDLDSLADVFLTVINSSGLPSELHTGLLASNPLKPYSCDADTLVGCALHSEVTYQNLEILGPNTASLNLVPRGIRSNSRVGQIRIKVRVRGDAALIPFDTTGWITFDYANVVMTSNVNLSGGRPRVSLRAGSVSTSMGTIDTDFSGLDGAVINIVTDWFNGRIKILVANLITEWMNGNLNSLLDDTFNTLDVHNLAAVFDVPLLDEASAAGIDFGTSFSTLNVSSRRILTSLGTQFQTVATHSKPTLGAPIPRGNRLLHDATSGTMSIAVHDGLLDQVLHALWSSGYFDASFVGGDLNGYVPPDVSLELDTMLPPAARLREDNRLELALGPVVARLDYPDLLSEPIELRLSMRGSCAPGLLGDDLTLDQCLVEELHLSFGSEPLDANTQTSLELFLTEIMNQVLVAAVNDALPVLPIPGLILPSSLTQFGLPGGREMRLLGPALSIAGDHAILDGHFGVH